MIPVSPRAVTSVTGPRARGARAGLPAMIVAKVDSSALQDIRREHSDGREDRHTFARHAEQTEGWSS